MLLSFATISHCTFFLTPGAWRQKKKQKRPRETTSHKAELVHISSFHIILSYSLQTFVYSLQARSISTIYYKCSNAPGRGYQNIFLWLQKEKDFMINWICVLLNQIQFILEYIRHEINLLKNRRKKICCSYIYCSDWYVQSSTKAYFSSCFSPSGTEVSTKAGAID